MKYLKQKFPFILFSITLFFISILFRDLNVDNIPVQNYAFIILALVFGLAIQKLFSRPFIKYFIDIFVFIVFCYQSARLTPNNYLIGILSTLPVILYYFYHCLFDFISPKKPALIFINLIPVFFVFKFFWQSTHPFSLWVAYTFLSGLFIVAPMFEENQTELTKLTFFKSALASSVFIIVLSLLTIF